MEKEIKVTNLVRFYTILLLAEKSKHGYELIKKVSESLRKKVSTGEIYPFLKQLKKYGYVKIRNVGRREKKIYTLTSSGRNFVRRMLERFGSLIDTAIEPKLTVCSHCGCEIYRGGYTEKIKGRKLTFCCPHCAKSFKHM